MACGITLAWNNVCRHYLFSALSKPVLFLSSELSVGFWSNWLVGLVTFSLHLLFSYCFRMGVMGALLLTFFIYTYIFWMTWSWPKPEISQLSDRQKYRVFKFNVLLWYLLFNVWCNVCSVSQIYGMFCFFNLLYVVSLIYAASGLYPNILWRAVYQAVIYEYIKRGAPKMF